MTLTDVVILTPEDPPPQPFIGIFHLWNDARGKRDAPEWPDFKLENIETRLIPWTVVVDVLPGANDFRYRFWGTARANLIGVEMAGKNASDIPDQHMRESNIQEYKSVCELKKPELCQTPVTTTTGRRVVFQSIRLPFIDNTGTVSNIISSMNFEQISAEHYKYYGTHR
jgi:hypothetical protein